MKFHLHGNPLVQGNTRKHNTRKLGHRTAHCSNRKSPFCDTGYLLKVCSKKDLKEISWKDKMLCQPVTV